MESFSENKRCFLYGMRHFGFMKTRSVKFAYISWFMKIATLVAVELRLNTN